MEPGRLEPSAAVGDSHHRDVRLDPLESNDAIDPASLDLRLAIHLESELNEERHRDRKASTTMPTRSIR